MTFTEKDQSGDPPGQSGQRAKFFSKELESLKLLKWLSKAVIVMNLFSGVV